MYTIKMDGKWIHAPAMTMDGYKVLAPKVSLDVAASGSLSFVLPPGHRLYHDIRRKKSVVTVYHDGAEIFRGRVLDDETDTYLQKDVYVEGVRGYLNDSLAAPYTYTGTPKGLLQKLIDEHNTQVEEEKRFILGRVTIDQADEAIYELQNVAHWETLKEIEEKLLSVYGGYLKIRVEGGALILDWLKEYGEENAQEIRFAVNLLDIKDKQDAGEVFTILKPLGASVSASDGTYGAPLTIASVNGGLDYIQDDEAIEKYGRIWKAYTWGNEEDPERLLHKAREYLKQGAELRTISLRAIDMRFLDGSAQAIRIGDKVQIISPAHDLALRKTCTKIEIDLVNPENTLYTFGDTRQVLTENMATTQSTLGSLADSGVKERVKKELRWVDEHITEQGQRLSRAEISIDGLNAQVLLKANVDEVTALGMRLSAAEIEIDGANAEIVLRAKQTEVDDLGKRVSSAEIRIDGAESTIELKADKTYVDNLIAQKIEAAIADISATFADSISTEYLVASTYATFNCPINYQGDAVQKTPITVITGISGGGVSSTDATLLTTRAGGARTIEAGSADALTAKYTQGAKYAGALYQPGTQRTIRQQGNLFQGTLFYGGSGETIYKRGDAYGGATLYIQVASNVYQRYNGSTLYYSGGSEWIVRQGEEYTAPLYEPGKDVTITQQGESVEDLGITLYREGTYHAGGLYTNFTPAQITLQDITALTA